MSASVLTTFSATARHRSIASSKTEPWHEVGSFAAYGEQMRSLRLRPWMFPPCWVSLDDPDPEHADAVALLRRLIDNNLSRYEPESGAALAQVEARPPAA